MDHERFAGYVDAAVAALPPEFLERLENLEVIIQDEPDAAQLASVGLGPEDALFGLYEGVPLTARSSNYGMVAPDKISIFQGPIEDHCHNDAEIIRQIRDTVYHEIAHHFGISDARIYELQRARRRRRL